MSARHTEGPWEWFMHSGGRPYLATPDRGRLYVMDFGRKGMQSATPRFSCWPGMSEGESRGRRGGIMEDGVLLRDGSLHPDARLIAAAPDLLFHLLAASNYIDALGGDSKSYRAAIAQATGSTP